MHAFGAKTLCLFGLLECRPTPRSRPCTNTESGTTFGDDWVRMGGAKFFSDGSLGARTALLAAPYADENRPDNLGIRIYDPDDLKAKARDAHEKGFQIVIHAIGDQAVRESVAAIIYALGPDGDNTFHRHRIEHASLLPPEELHIMAERKIVAVIQPQFVLSDTWTGERVGPERAAWAYPFAQMEAAGIPLALSSDCPVEKLDAFACLSAVVGRAAGRPKAVFLPKPPFKPTASAAHIRSTPKTVSARSHRECSPISSSSPPTRQN